MESEATDTFSKDLKGSKMVPQMFSFVDLICQILQFLNTRLRNSQKPVYKSLDTARIEAPLRTQKDV